MTFIDRRRFLNRGLVLGTFGASWLAGTASLLSNERPLQHKSIVMIWLAGGPATIDLWDLKPNHANGGPFRPISTTVPGLQISEHLPLLSRRADQLTLIRSMSSAEGDHDRATHYLRTGYKPAGAIQFPALGALIASETFESEAKLPLFISIASTRQLLELGNGFLPQQFAPLAVVSSEDNKSLIIPGLTNPANKGGLQVDRQRLVERLDSIFLDQPRGTIAESVRSARSQALKLQDPSISQVFNMENSTEKEREKYGTSTFGKSCLMARRLVERHVPCIEVTLPGWDAHRNNFETVKSLSSQLDQALSALMGDLDQQGLLDNTLIVCHGEFGRTPNINGNYGRDHFPNAWSVLLAGGGIGSGKVIGETSKDGMEVVGRPVKIPDLIASVCHWADIDYRKQNMSNVRRPIRIADVDAQIINELFS